MNKFFIVMIITIPLTVGLGLYFYDALISGNVFPSDNLQKWQAEEFVRIGYAHAGRAATLWRAYVDRYFWAENVKVEFYSKYLHQNEWHKVSDRIFEMDKFSEDYNYFGVVGGQEIIEAIEAGELDGGVVGAASFVHAVNNGVPVVAVITLEYDAEDRAIIMNSNVIINNPEDFKGKTLSTQRTGPDSIIFLKEFIKSIGLDPEKDVTILEQIPEDELYELAKEKKVDGGLWHSPEASMLVKDDLAYIYRKMDWMDPRLSHGLLIFRKDFMETHSVEIEKIVRAYIKKVKHDHDILGENYPRTDYPPLVRVDLLEGLQDLLFEYGKIDGKVDLARFINNDFVKRAE